MIRSLARAMGLLPEPQTADLADAAPVGEPGDPDPDPDADIDATAVAADAEQRALERWWDEVEERVLAEEWDGAESPPVEELAHYWAEESRWAEPDDGDALQLAAEPMDGGPESIPGASAAAVDGRAQPAGWWEAADRAVNTASAALWEAEVALGRARGAVERAEIAAAADETAWQQGADGRLSAAADTLTALTQTTADRRAQLVDLLDATAGGGLSDRPRIALADALTGTPLVLTDSRELRSQGTCGRPACRTGVVVCAHDLRAQSGLRPPPPTPGYRPGAALDRHLRARDRRCRFPGCRNRVPRGGKLDHNRPWPDGPTSAANLTGYCTSHHRGKHQAPGWQYDQALDGTLTVTTPTGLVAATTPPPF
jgi:hypothetical protein